MCASFANWVGDICACLSLGCVPLSLRVLDVFGKVGDTYANCINVLVQFLCRERRSALQHASLFVMT